MGILHGQSGRGALSGIVALAFVAAAAFVALRFYHPFRDAWIVEHEIKAAALHCVTHSTRDERCLESYDQAIRARGIEFPSSSDIQWVRVGPQAIEIGYAYDEDVDLLVTKTTLRFRFHCRATPAGCVNDAE